MGKNLIEPQRAIGWLCTRANKEVARGSKNDFRQRQEHDLVRAAEQLPTSSHGLA
jgi:hypothetical protein